MPKSEGEKEKQDKGEWVRGPTLHAQTPAVRAFSEDAAVGQKAGLYYIFRLSPLKTPMKSGFFSGLAKAESYTVGQWMDVWFEYYAKIKVRASSHKTYEGYIKNHIKPNVGSIPLTKLTTLDLQMMYQKLLTGGRVDRLESQNQPKGLSAKTVRNLNQIISSAMKLAMDQNSLPTILRTAVLCPE